MPELNLNKRRKERENENLGVIIGDKTYYIPLGKSLKIKEISHLDKPEEIMRKFRERVEEV